jgi:hypothetical protein
MNEKRFAVITAKEQAATAVNMMYSAVNASAESERAWLEVVKELDPVQWPRYNLIVNDLNNALPNKYELLIAIYEGSIEKTDIAWTAIQSAFGEYDYDAFRYLDYCKENVFDNLIDLESAIQEYLDNE